LRLGDIASKISAVGVLNPFTRFNLASFSDALHNAERIL
jgi:hypothetical protein